MDNVRRLEQSQQPLPCTRCGHHHHQRCWDTVGGQTICPNCLELLSVGGPVEGDIAPLRIPTEDRQCAACDVRGTVRFCTFPLNSQHPVEFDLCGRHVRALAGRRLSIGAFDLLRLHLRILGLDVSEIFLLHEAFYDRDGRSKLNSSNKGKS
jgi:hypothetical protein